jgi:hypothetical protein
MLLPIGAQDRRVSHQNKARTQNENPHRLLLLYGHVFKLAQAVKEGAESVKGTEVLFRRVEEFDIVLKKTADNNYLNQLRGESAQRHWTE